jgi:undecaprenyl-diphosphatase
MGTMIAVIVYFWRRWRSTYFQNAHAFKSFGWQVIFATATTGIVGEVVVKVIEKTVLRGDPHAEIETLFGRLDFIAPALAAVGLLILTAGIFEKRRSTLATSKTHDLNTKRAGLIGLVQGFCLPFRGFSRSGATISTGMLLGMTKFQAEAFSFALAVVLTPPVIFREAHRLVHSESIRHNSDLVAVALFSVFGALVAFVAGLLALKWLSRWLESGRWYFFGIYCLAAAIVVAGLHRIGY